MPANLIIDPNRTLTGIPTITFVGCSGSGISLQVAQNGSISFIGTMGQLFGITDSLSGSLMSVTDIAGLPIWEVFSDDRVVMGTFNANTLVVSGRLVGIGTASPAAPLHVTGAIRTDNGFFSGTTNIATLFGSVGDVASTGQQAWTAANNNSVNLSGNLSTIYTPLISPSLRVTGNFILSGFNKRYVWSGISITWTGTLASPATVSGADIWVKNIATGASLLLSGSVDYGTNYTVIPKASLHLWSDNNTWLVL